MNIRQIVLDTETTGLDPEDGHRIIEIGCVELVNRRPTDNRFHQYLDPGRDVDEGALAVHGITNDFLKDKPRFSDVARDFLAYVKDAELIIHNAPFDVAFLNEELRLIDDAFGRIEDYCTILDTLTMARQMHPGQRNDLDALCRRYHIENSQRTLHGALLDAEILADVYLAMTGGQTSLRLDDLEPERADRVAGEPVAPRARQALRIILADEQELSAHEAWLQRLDREAGGACVWRRFHSEDYTSDTE